MSKNEHILSVIHYTIWGAVCFQFAHFPCDDWENIYTLSYYHNQIGSMNYYPLFRIRSWSNGVRCMSFYILIRGTLKKLCFFKFTSKCDMTAKQQLKWHVIRLFWGVSRFPYRCLTHWSLGDVFITLKKISQNVADEVHELLLWNYSPMNATGHTVYLVGIGLRNGLMHEATSYWLGQCWARSMSLYGVTGPQCVGVRHWALEFSRYPY